MKLKNRLLLKLTKAKIIKVKSLAKVVDPIKMLREVVKDLK